MSTTVGLLLNPKIITEDQALALYNAAFNLLLEGKTYMEFSGEGTEFRTQFPIPVATMLAEAAYCLQQINPDTYGNIRTQVQPYFT